MIIWGGFSFATGALNTGARYNPATDSWMATNIVNAPPARSYYTSVWTGGEMIIWGGYNNGEDLNTGGRYNPNTNTWTPTSITNAPQAREAHTAVWTGSEMIVWGGIGCGSNCRLNTGSRYNPITDSWTPISTINAPAARGYHTAVWTGSEMIVWGGSSVSNPLSTGGRYNPTTDTWTPTRVPPSTIPGRIAYSCVWTGNEMIVWGGVDETFIVNGTGGRYNPVTDSWVATSLTGAPLARVDHTGVWTGREMVIWGGYSQTMEFNDGKRYDPGTDSWTPITTANAPLARGEHTGVWSGTQMIVWGGTDQGGFELNTGGVYCAQPSTPLVQRAASRKTHGNAGSFDVNLPLGGTPGVECRSGGATNDYTIVVTFLANVSVNGNPPAAVSSGVATIGSGGVSDGGMVAISGNVVTIPLTNVANTQTLSVTLNKVNGSTDVTIPMGVLIGDANGNGAVNASDVAFTKRLSGLGIGPLSFRADVNADGGNINAVDVALVKSLAGTGLP